MNFLWNSDRSESLMKRDPFLSGSERAQFLKTTSSSQRRFIYDKSNTINPETAKAL